MYHYTMKNDYTSAWFIDNRISTWFQDRKTSQTQQKFEPYENQIILHGRNTSKHDSMYNFCVIFVLALNNI